MKKNIFYSLLCVMVVSFIFTACDKQDTDENMNDAGMSGINKAGSDNTSIPAKIKATFWDKNKDYSYDDKDQFRLAVTDALDKIDARITYIQDTADNAAGETKDNINKKINNLKVERGKISERMNDWGRISQDKWEDFKSDIAEAFDDVTNDYNQFVRNMDNNNQDRNY